MFGGFTISSSIKYVNIFFFFCFFVLIISIFYPNFTSLFCLNITIYFNYSCGITIYLYYFQLVFLVILVLLLRFSFILHKYNSVFSFLYNYSQIILRIFTFYDKIQFVTSIYNYHLREIIALIKERRALWNWSINS